MAVGVAAVATSRFAAGGRLAGDVQSTARTMRNRIEIIAMTFDATFDSILMDGGN
jgi:hypothetical protein